MPTAIPAGGLFRISSIIPNNKEPGSRKTSPASRFGVITEFKPELAKVLSSKCETEEPFAYLLGV